MKAIQHYLQKGFFESVRSILFLLLGLFVIAKINSFIALLIFFLLLLSLAFTIYAYYHQKKLVALSRNKRSAMLAYVARTFNRFSRMKMENNELEKEQGFIQKSADLLSANTLTNNRESLIQSIVAALPFVLISILIIVTATKLVHLSHTNAITIVLILMLMQTALKAVLKMPGYINKGIISLQKIDEIMSP
jgi:ABC-type transport system involved in cytochrome bd biosynthesis fused ATPase/permease subunit